MRDGLSENTVISYLKTIQQFNSMYKTISLQNIYSYKGFLIENYKVKTVNLRIQALNKYLEFKNINEILILHEEEGEIFKWSNGKLKKICDDMKEYFDLLE